MALFQLNAFFQTCALSLTFFLRSKDCAVVRVLLWYFRWKGKLTCPVSLVMRGKILRPVSDWPGWLRTFRKRSGSYFYFIFISDTTTAEYLLARGEYQKDFITCYLEEVNCYFVYSHAILNALTTGKRKLWYVSSHIFHYIQMFVVYYLLVSKVCVYDLAAGVTKMSFGELIQGHTTDVSL